MSEITVIGILERKRGLEMQKKDLQQQLGAVERRINDLNLQLNEILDNLK